MSIAVQNLTYPTECEILDFERDVYPKLSSARSGIKYYLDIGQCLALNLTWQLRLCRATVGFHGAVQQAYGAGGPWSDSGGTCPLPQLTGNGVSFSRICRPNGPPRFGLGSCDRRHKLPSSTHPFWTPHDVQSPGRPTTASTPNHCPGPIGWRIRTGPSLLSEAL